MRVVQTIPAFIFLAALGFRRLMISFPGKTLAMGLWAVAVGALSLGCDTYHLFGAYHQWCVPAQDPGYNCKSLERQRAFAVFEEAQRRWGPGLILTNLVDEVHDQTLGLSTWWFNAAENPGAGECRRPWVGLLCNVHDRDYLSRHIPETQCQGLAAGLFRENGGLMACVLPVNAENLSTLRRWVVAEKAMHLFTGGVLEKGLSHRVQALSAQLDGLYPLFRGDPFLESCFWEKKAQFAFMAKNYRDMVDPLQKAIQRGIPEAHLYNRLGVVNLVLGDYGGAGRALEQAMRCPDNQTSAKYLYEHFYEQRHPLRFP
jgi:hypothetical protein